MSPDTREMSNCWFDGLIIRAAVVCFNGVRVLNKLRGDQVRLSVPVDEPEDRGLVAADVDAAQDISVGPPTIARGEDFAVLTVEPQSRRNAYLSTPNHMSGGDMRHTDARRHIRCSKDIHKTEAESTAGLRLVLCDRLLLLR